MPATSGNPCLMAGSGTPCDRSSYHRHHVLTQQVLRRHGHGDLLYRRENMVILCQSHHARHHARIQPVPRELLPAEVFEFAAEVGLEWWLDRFYPVNATTGGRAA